MTRRTVVLVATVVVALAVPSGYVAWRAQAARAAWREARPSAPSWREATPELRRRVTEADARLAAYPPDVAALGDVARLYHANGYLAEAERAYRALLQFDPANPRWPHLLGTLLAGFGRLEEAIPLFERAVAGAPDYLPARLDLGDALLKEGRIDQAARAYEGVLTLAPANGYATVGLARIDLARDRLTAARERLSRAAAADPRFFAAQTLLASVYAQLGDDEAAANARLRAGAAGRFREAPDRWRDELVDFCYDSYRLQVTAATATATGDNRRAIAILRHAVTLAPDDARSLSQLGSCLLAEGDIQEAAAPLARTVELSPQDSAAWVALATCRSAAGDPAAAAQTLERGLQVCPDPGPLEAELAALLLRRGRPAEALPHFAAAVRLNPETPEVTRDYINTLFEMGRSDDAEAALRAAVARHPKFAPLLVQSARLNIRHREPTAAADFIGRARNAGATPADLARLTAEFRNQFGRNP
jgi:tetratricopeptide (TPR) repeat protein